MLLKKRTAKLKLDNWGDRMECWSDGIVKCWHNAGEKNNNFYLKSLASLIKIILF